MTWWCYYFETLWCLPFAAVRASCVYRPPSILCLGTQTPGRFASDIGLDGLSRSAKLGRDNHSRWVSSSLVGFERRSIPWMARGLPPCLVWKSLEIHWPSIGPNFDKHRKLSLNHRGGCGGGGGWVGYSSFFCVTSAACNIAGRPSCGVIWSVILTVRDIL